MRPEHLAIVMDGNGRWAEQRRRPRGFGHQAGVRAARRTVEACAERDIAALTLFAFSSENWERPQNEVRRLLQLLARVLEREIDELDENGVSLRFIGDLTAFSPELQDRMHRAQSRTAANDRLILSIAVNYGGRWDMIQATRSVAAAVARGELRLDQIDVDELRPFFALADLPEPDLLIRTGGERRLSNFLLWQLAYTELYFTDCLWPDFGAEELDLALEDFSHRQRRFGRLEERSIANA